MATTPEPRRIGLRQDTKLPRREPYVDSFLALHMLDGVAGGWAADYGTARRVLHGLRAL
jgi:hypothetical protein